jgi:hypothetical protein
MDDGVTQGVQGAVPQRLRFGHVTTLIPCVRAERGVDRVQAETAGNAKVCSNGVKLVLNRQDDVRLAFHNHRQSVAVFLRFFAGCVPAQEHQADWGCLIAHRTLLLSGIRDSPRHP